MVTGASGGIGKAAALGLAKKGATVILVCHNRTNGELAATEIKSVSGNSNIFLICGDLSNRKGVHDVADGFKDRFGSLHILVNNAGALVPKRYLTADGLEMTFGLNHLGYFHLTNLLLNTMKRSAPSRIINVASDVHRYVQLDLVDTQSEHGYSSMKAYARSKLANIMFTYELAHRLEGKEITVNCMHPGAVKSDFYRNASGPVKTYYSLFGWTMRSPEKGAETIVYLASSVEVTGITGKYFIDKKQVLSSEHSRDSETSRKLWELSEHLTSMK